MSDLSGLARRLGYEFSDSRLLAQALTHRSFSSRHNERLEFLGDSVLGLLVTELLYERYPDVAEGVLTRMRVSLVRRETLAEVARRLDLGACLRLGGGELRSGGFERDSILADAVEAILGAVYLDGGLDAARRVARAHLAPWVTQLDPRAPAKDPKTRLQELLQQRGEGLPVYEVSQVSGTDHQRHFVILCKLSALETPLRGEGRTRRGAEQAAAEAALRMLAADDE